jgi:hypothetical protein
MDPAASAIIIAILSSKELRSVFKKIADLRKAKLVELAEDTEAPAGTDKLEVAEKQLEQLRDAKLVAEEKAPFREWNTYYVTADGLEMMRTLKRLES